MSFQKRSCNLCRELVHSWRLMSFWVATLDWSEHWVLNYTCQLLILHVVLLTSYQMPLETVDAHLLLSIFQHPSPTIYHGPTTMHPLPSTIRRLQAIAYSGPTSICPHQLPSAVYHPRTTIGQLLSAVYYPPSTINSLPSAVYHPPSTIYSMNDFIMIILSRYYTLIGRGLIH